MKKQKIYLAGPLGFSEAGKFFLDSVLIPIITKLGFEVLNPWTLTPAELINSALILPYGQERKNKWNSINSVIGKNNLEAIKESDLIVAILDGSDIDSGTAAEIGFASALGKVIIGYRGDFRISADNEGCAVNLQVEYFINLNGGEIVTSLESLKTTLIFAKHKYS